MFSNLTPLFSRRFRYTGGYQTFANENHENVAKFSRPQHCSLCHTISKHKESVEKIIRKTKDDPNRPKINSNDFKSKPICTIKTPKGEKNLCLDDIEQMYINDHPEWNQKFQCFPEGPLYYDKLFKENPFKRAVDIENKRTYLKEKIILISELPFEMGKNCDKQIIEKTKNAIMDSLQTVIESLKLLDNVHVMKSLPIGLMNMVKGKLKELKDETKGIGAAQKLQIDAFDMVLKNDNDFKLYEIR